VAKQVTSVMILLMSILVGTLLFSGCTTNSSGESSSTTGFNLTSVIFVVIIALLFYLFIIRPQRNRQSSQRKLMSDLKPGDQVITVSGIYGEIESLDEESVVLKTEFGAKIRVAKLSIAGKRS
jgi:preprotein translocase subunit YajC